MNQRGFAPIVLIIVLLVIVLVGIGGYLVGTNKFSQPNKESSQSIVLTPSPVATSNQTSNLATEFKKRQFNPDETIGGTKVYQSKVLNILQGVKDDDLLGMSCSPQYQYIADIANTVFKSNFNYYNKETQKSIDITDPTAVQQLKNLIEKAPSTIPTTGLRDITVCSVEDGSQIIEYESVNNSIATAYIALSHNSTGAVNLVKSMSGTSSFFGCPQPLQLTKSNQLYYKCGEGEADTGKDFYYQIDLVKDTSNLVAQCTFQSGSPEPPTITCQ